MHRLLHTTSAQLYKTSFLSNFKNVTRVKLKYVKYVKLNRSKTFPEWIQLHKVVRLKLKTDLSCSGAHDSPAHGVSMVNLIKSN